MFTLMVVIFVLVLLSASLLFVQGPDKEEAVYTSPDQPDNGLLVRSGADGNDTELSAWVAGSWENLTDIASKIEDAGNNMNISAARSYGHQLLAMTESYSRSLSNMTLNSTLEPVRSEFREVLSDLKLAVEHGDKGAANMDMGEINAAMNYYEQASTHATTAMDLANRTK